MAKGKLYRGRGTKAAQMRAFRRRYGPRGAAVYGAVVGKVHREQVALGEPGKTVENVKEGWVPTHMSRRGRKKFRVKGHRVRAHKARIRA